MIPSIKVPLRVPVTSKKWYTISINTMRTAHFRVSAKAKRVFHKEIEALVEKLPIMSKVEVKLVIYAKNKRRFDIDNLALLMKFTMDVLIELGKLPDDDYNHMPRVIIEYGGINKDDPHGIVSFKEITSDNNN